MHEQIFISGVWHSGTSLIAEIAKLNGYDLGRATNSKNDNGYAWRGPINSLGSPLSALNKDYDYNSVKGILERSHPFNIVDEEENELFKECILKSRNDISTPPRPSDFPPHIEYHCCKLPGLSLMTPHIAKAFPDAPIIHVVRNPIDISLSATDNYFLARLIQDKVTRDTNTYELGKGNTIGYLFAALGRLEWKIRKDEKKTEITHNREKILWNALYSLRYALIMDRLKLDILNHNIKNHHIIKFENLITGNQRRAEIEKLRNILGVEGKLKMPAIDKTKAYKYESYIPSSLSNKSIRGDLQLTYKLIYEICEPYLKGFGYERVSEFMKKLDLIDA